MAGIDLFLSYSSTDLAAAEILETWLMAPPRNRTIWRDRRGILPGAPDYYPPILAGISASANFLLLLSPRWLRSKVAACELADAMVAGKKIVPVVHPSIPRDPKDAVGREQKAELIQALQASGLAPALERANWIWLVTDKSTEPDFMQVELALATDFVWAVKHAIIVQRLDRWKEVQDDAVLLRGSELVELTRDAFADAPDRKPVLTAEQREFLHASQRHEVAERERMEGLYWGAQARAVAFAARERSETEPDTALLLAAEAASVATVPEARAVLLSLLHRHAWLTKMLNGHGTSREISGVAFSPDGCWLASIDKSRALGDERPAHLLIHRTETGREGRRIAAETSFTAVAWGERWLAAASQGSIGWLRWDELDEKFRGNTPTSLENNVMPDYLAFSPRGLNLPSGEMIVWGTQWGDIGFIRVGDHERWQGRLGDDRSNRALKGLGWLQDGRLITAEGGRILARPFPGLEPPQEIASPGLVYSLTSDGERWVAACTDERTGGILLGKGDKVVDFLSATTPDLGLIAAWAGPSKKSWIMTGSTSCRSGEPAVTLLSGKVSRNTLLQGGNEPMTKVAADPSGRFMAAGESGGRVWLWDRSRQSHLVSQARLGTTVCCFATSAQGQTVLATHDGRILFFGPNIDDAPVGDLSAPFLAVRMLFTDSGKALLLESEDRLLAKVGMDVGVQHVSWPPGVASPSYIVAASDAPVIAVLGEDNAIAVLNLLDSTLVPVCTIDPGMHVLRIALDPAGQRVYALVEKLGLGVVTWRVELPHEAPTDVATICSGLPLAPIAFPNQNLVAIGDELDLLLVPSDSHETALRLSGHDEPIKRIVCGVGLIASIACCFQNTEVDQVRLWTTEGHPLGPVTLPEHIVDIEFCPDSSALLALGQSGTLWKVMLRSADWVDTARRIAGRSFTEEEQRRYGIDAWRAQAPPTAKGLFS